MKPMDARVRYPDILRHACFRALDWRWRRAVELRGVITPGRDDAWTERATRYLNFKLDAEIHAARELAQLPDLRDARLEAEARILAGLSDEEIATRSGLLPGTVECFEALFFQVRDKLHALDWILVNVIGGGFWNALGGGDWPGTVLKYLGYTAGADLLDLFIAVLMDRPLPQWASATQLDAYSEHRLRLRCKLLARALTSRSAAELAAIVEIHESAEQLDRSLTGKRRDCDEPLQAMTAWLRQQRRRRRRSARKSKTPKSREAAHQPTPCQFEDLVHYIEAQNKEQQHGQARTESR